MCKKNLRSIVLNTLFYTLIILILAGTILFASSKKENKSIFGYRFYEALSDSMSPTIRKGDFLLVELKEPNQIQVNDVITYAANEKGSVTVTHRVKEIFKDGKNDLYFITKGDESKEQDQPVHQSKAIGVVRMRIPYIGFGIGWLRRNTTLILSIMIILGIIIFIKKKYAKGGNKKK